jgi:hypothetical protein
MIGLDVGTSRIVMARQAATEMVFESQLNAFVSIPYSKMTENSLKREGINFATQGQEIIVHGNDAPRFADLLHVETRRPMVQGVLNPSETESVPVVRRIVESMMSRVDGQPRIYFTVPAAPLNTEEGLTYHEATLRQMLGDLANEARPINEGLAVIYAELEDTNFTGIGVSCGGGLCNVSLAYLSMPALSFSIPKAGDFIDASTASVTGDLANRVRLIKEESFHFNGHFSDKLHQVLTVYYDDVIQAVVNGMREAFADTRRIPKLSKPIPLVLSGGTAAPKGFRERFEKILRASDFPIAISEVRSAKNQMTATARGALVAAMTEM